MLQRCRASLEVTYVSDFARWGDVGTERWFGPAQVLHHTQWSTKCVRRWTLASGEMGSSCGTTKYLAGVRLTVLYKHGSEERREKKEGLI